MILLSVSSLPTPKCACPVCPSSGEITLSVVRIFLFFSQEHSSDASGFRWAFPNPFFSRNPLPPQSYFESVTLVCHRIPECLTLRLFPLFPLDAIFGNSRSLSPLILMFPTANRVDPSPPFLRLNRGGGLLISFPCVVYIVLVRTLFSSFPRPPPSSEPVLFSEDQCRSTLPSLGEALPNWPTVPLFDCLG